MPWCGRSRGRWHDDSPHHYREAEGSPRGASKRALGSFCDAEKAPARVTATVDARAYVPPQGMTMADDLTGWLGLVPLVLVAGVLDMAANALFLLAAREGLLAVTGVLASALPGEHRRAGPDGLARGWSRPRCWASAPHWWRSCSSLYPRRGRLTRASAPSASGSHQHRDVSSHRPSQ